MDTQLTVLTRILLLIVISLLNFNILESDDVKATNYTILISKGKNYVSPTIFLNIVDLNTVYFNIKSQLKLW